MFTGHIQSGNWDTGVLDISGMPKDFVLSARNLVVMEECEYHELVSEMYNPELKTKDKKPEPTGLSAKIRKFAVMYENELPRRAEITLLFESCKEIDRLKDELVCEECEKSLEDPETGVTAICIPCWNAMVTKLRAEIDSLTAENKKYETALNKLARLGAEPMLGNSIGNEIAQEALTEYADNMKLKHIRVNDQDGKDLTNANHPKRLEMAKEYPPQDDVLELLSATPLNTDCDGYTARKLNAWQYVISLQQALKGKE